MRFNRKPFMQTKMDQSTELGDKAQTQNGTDMREVRNIC